ncbi:helix-turn-helix transcriptional regulator [Nocardioides dongkuii]|uniref:helix-turn-helix transcriptional regulator n=1 Tax=Nocardioides dongkuii TaxID=2760089 RepID=UPI0015F7BA0A|nr:response regulator transcription factor [Nocardioides dongkuii]
MTSDPWRVAVVSRHPVVLEGVRSLLATEPERLAVVDLSLTDGHLAGLDVVLYDLVGLAEAHGDDLAHLVRANTTVLGIERDHRAELTSLARRLGVTAVVPLSATADELVSRVCAAARGEKVEDACLSRARRSGARLSPRELEVVAAIAAGQTNQQIADSLHLSVNTVKTTIHHTYAKIGVRHRAQAVAWFLGPHADG